MVIILVDMSIYEQLSSFGPGPVQVQSLLRELERTKENKDIEIEEEPKLNSLCHNKSAQRTKS